MKGENMFKTIGVLCLSLWALPVWAAPLSNEACEKLLVSAEEKPIDGIYDDCGFGDEMRAWSDWAPFAAAHDMKRALFELCQRYPNHIYGALYCEKATQLNYGPALAYMGHRAFKNGKTDLALDYFNKALKAGDLPEQEILQLTELLGVMYMTEGSDHYNPRSGIALLSKVANQKSALANNVLGYLVYTGKNGVKKDPQKALEFIWRAILYGCPAAEENLGAFHLARQGKISEDDASYYMSLQAFTCQPFDKNQWAASPVAGCDCDDIRRQDVFFHTQPYLYLGYDNKALLEDKDGKQIYARTGDTLANGMVVQEITPTLVTLTEAGNRIFVNRYHTGTCVTRCLSSKEPPKRQPVGIRPYHLTFSKQECSDIAYYADRLIDTTGDYVGKKECLGPEMDETTKLLLQMK